MKQIHEYDTPETEAHPSRWQQLPSAEFIHADFARNLEQRLAACRDVLKEIDPYPDQEIEPSTYGIYCEITVAEMIRIRETLTLTAPK